MKHSIADWPHATQRKKPTAARYWFAVALQALSFYCGFTYLLNPNVPPAYRLIAGCIFFPLAAISAWWGGHIALFRKGEKHYALVQLFETLPVRIFLGVLLAAVVIAAMDLAGAF